MMLCGFVQFIVFVGCVFIPEIAEARRHLRHRSRPISLIQDIDVEGYLKHFGYMKEIPAGIVGDSLRDVGDRDRQVEDAIKKFQYFYGLHQTGRMDRRTMQWMKKSRCGVSDFSESDREKRSSTPQRFTHLGSKWNTNRLTWKLTRPTQKLTRDDQRKTISAAFKIWEDVAPLSIQETAGEPDMEIFFARGEHGDGNGNAFDGRSHVLAHAFGPGESKISGDAHFDNDEEWSLDSSYGSDFLVVAAHEFGHSLGLGHSRDKGALMFPAYQSQENLKLGYDDIRALQILYGSRISPNGGITRQPPRRTRPPQRRTHPPPERQTTPAPVPKTTTPPQPCNVNFDAIVEGPGRFYYAMRQGSVFKFRESGVEPDFPKSMSEVFEGAPSDIDFAFSIARTSKIYIVKDNKVWRYTNMELDKDFPLQFNRQTFPETPRFVLSLIDDRGKSRVILFGERKWWFYSFDDIHDSIPIHYDISSNWRGVPSGVQFSVRWSDNNYYLVTSNSHVKFDHNRRTASREGEVSGLPPWLDRTCSAVMDKIGNNSEDIKPVVLFTMLLTVIARMLS